MIKRFIMSMLILYPCIELSRLIVVYPHWEPFDVRPWVELGLIWIGFILAVWLSEKEIKKR
jgi:hypothetical protein